MNHKTSTLTSPINSTLEEDEKEQTFISLAFLKEYKADYTGYNRLRKSFQDNYKTQKY